MPADFSRLQRTQSLIQSRLAKIIQTESQDPRFQMMTITGAKVSKDLSVAKIYFILHNEESKGEVLKALKHAASFFRYRLAQELELRKIPVLYFYFDESVFRGMRISKLLQDAGVKSE